MASNSYAHRIVHVWFIVFYALNKRDSRQLCEHEATWPSIQTSPGGSSKCSFNQTNMCDQYSCIVYPNPNIITLLKHRQDIKVSLFFVWISLYKMASVYKLSNIITTSLPAKQKHRRNDQPGCNAFMCNVIHLVGFMQNST